MRCHEPKDFKIGPMGVGFEYTIIESMGLRNPRSPDPWPKILVCFGRRRR